MTQQSDKFTCESTAGGVGGAHLLIKLGDRVLGHFYPDYEKEEDYEAFIEYLEAYNR